MNKGPICFMCEQPITQMHITNDGRGCCSSTCAWGWEASCMLSAALDSKIDTIKPKCDKEIQSVIDMLASVFMTKQVEYKGAHPDIFRNFNLGADLQHESPEQTLLGYVNKQIVSLYDAKHVNPERLKDIGFVEEKAKDIAIYMIILIAMVRRHNVI